MANAKLLFVPKALNITTVTHAVLCVIRTRCIACKAAATQNSRYQRLPSLLLISFHYQRLE